MNPIGIELVRTALLASFWRKDALRRFLRRMHVTDSALGNLNGVGSKRDFIDWLFPQLERTERGRSLLRAIGNELCVQTTFPDLEGWEDSERKKKVATASVRALREHFETEAEASKNESLRRTRRETAERERAANVARAHSLDTLRKRLDALAPRLGEQRAGYEFQDWFGDLCLFFELDYKKPYRANGRETDGSVTVGDMTYLLSLKFESTPLAPADVSEMKGRLHKVADYTMGLIVAMAGVGPNAIGEASGAQSSLLLFDHTHLYYILGGTMSLPELVSRVRRHASRTGECLVKVTSL